MRYGSRLFDPPQASRSPSGLAKVRRARLSLPLCVYMGLMPCLFPPPLPPSISSTQIPCFVAKRLQGPFTAYVTGGSDRTRVIGRGAQPPVDEAGV